MTKLLETIKVVDGNILHVNYHQIRLEHSMKVLNYSTHYDLKSLIVPPKKGTFRCRVLYSNSSINIEYIPYETKKISSLKVVTDDNILYDLKYENRNSLNKLFNLRGNCDDIAIIKNGHLTDSTIANIALFDGEHWYTPNTPLLHGTTRQRLLDNQTIFTKEIPESTIATYKKSAIFNAMIGFVELEDGIIFK
ncbi:MAG: aminotransferase class IV [Campylobacterota bacterium]|nr:aminotransferase class IV [Campylobacterota bacterium]